MSNTQQKAIVNKLLTNVSNMYKPSNLIAGTVFPSLKVKQFTGLLAGYGKDHLRIVNSVVGGKGKYRQVEGITRKSSSYHIEGHGLTSIVTEEDYNNVEDPYDAEQDETMALTTILALEKEKGLADVLNNVSVLTQNITLSGTSQFNDYANSDVIKVMTDAKKTIKAATGEAPNTAIMDWGVAEVLRYHPQLLDLLGFKYSRPGGLGNEELAKALNLRKIFIPDAAYNSAKEGQADVMTPIWAKNIVLGVIPDKAAKYQLSLGYDITLTGKESRKVYKQDLFNPPGSTEILVEDKYDQILSDASCGYLIKDAIA